MRRRTCAVLMLLLAFFIGAQATAERMLTLTFAGDCTLGGEEQTRRNADSFDSFAAREGYGYFFENFRELFSGDDCTVVSCDGVLADSEAGAAKSKGYRFRGPEAFARIFREGSVEAVSLGNYHSGDYGGPGLESTRRALESEGIGWAREKDFWFFEKDGIRVAFVSVDYGIFQRSRFILRDMLLQMRADGEIQAAVVWVHQGKEYSPVHNAAQKQYAEFFITEAGADLVVMTFPHVVQGIRILNGRSVFYSLGNFACGGSNRIHRTEQTNSLYSLAVQARLFFTDEGEYKGQQTVLYPAWASGEERKNNYQPIRLTAEQAVPVLEAMQKDTAWTLPAIQTDGNGYACVILDYLPAEEKTAGETGTEGVPEAAPAKPDRNRP